MSLIRLLMLAVAVVGTNTFVLSPIAPDVAVSFGVGPADVLVASSVYGIGTALGALFIAPQADRLGLDRALFLSLVALTLGLTISAGATHVYMLSGAQALAGAAAGVALPAAYGLAAEVAEPGHESETMGKVLAGWTISLVIGVAFSAAFSEFTHWRRGLWRNGGRRVGCDAAFDAGRGASDADACAALVPVSGAFPAGAAAIADVRIRLHDGLFRLLRLCRHAPERGFRVLRRRSRASAADLWRWLWFSLSHRRDDRSGGPRSRGSLRFCGAVLLLFDPWNCVRLRCDAAGRVFRLGGVQSPRTEPFGG